VVGAGKELPTKLSHLRIFLLIAVEYSGQKNHLNKDVLFFGINIWYIYVFLQSPPQTMQKRADAWPAPSMHT
jgi:hypothetical protein